MSVFSVLGGGCASCVHVIRAAGPGAAFCAPKMSISGDRDSGKGKGPVKPAKGQGGPVERSTSALHLSVS